MSQFALFKLIKSLTSSEKNYFIQRAKAPKSGEPWKYIELFKEIDNQDKYNERKLKEVLVNKGIIKTKENFPEAKKNLYSLILKSLRNYHSEKNYQIKLQEYRTNLNILMGKGLWEQALDMIKKAKKIAHKGGLRLYDLEFNLWERRIVRQLSEQARELLPPIQENSDTLITLLNKEIAIMKLFEELFLQSQRYDMAQLASKLNKIIGEDEAAYLKVASFDSKTHYYSLWGFYYRRVNDFEKSKQKWNELLSLFEENEGEALKELEYQERYLNALNNYFNICYLMDSLEKDYEDITYRMDQIITHNYSLKVRKFYTEYHLKILFNFQKRRYDQVVGVASHIKKMIKEYGNDIPPNRRLSFVFNIALAHFMNRDYSIAITDLSKIIKDKRFEIIKTYQHLARVLKILLLYEMDEQEAALPLIRATKKIKDLDATVTHIIETIRKLCHLPKTEHRPYLIELQKSLKDNKDYQELYIWLDEHLRHSRRS